MVKCLCCKRNEAHIILQGDYIINICGQSDCKSPEGKTLGEWLMEGHDDPTKSKGTYNIIRDLKEFTIEINHKEYTIPNDKRIVKTLQNKIRDIILGKQKQ